MCAEIAFSALLPCHSQTPICQPSIVKFICSMDQLAFFLNFAAKNLTLLQAMHLPSQNLTRQYTQQFCQQILLFEHAKLQQQKPKLVLQTIASARMPSASIWETGTYNIATIVNNDKRWPQWQQWKITPIDCFWLLLFIFLSLLQYCKYPFHCLSLYLMKTSLYSIVYQHCLYILI